MQGGQPDSGRGVYVARRIVAALVILLLLVLLVPRACQALFPEERSSSEVPNSEVPETGATNEDTVAEQASITDSEPGDNEIAAEGSTDRTTDSAEASRDENAEVIDAEIVVDLTQAFTSPEPSVGGADIAAGDVGADQIAPIPGVDDQQPVQPPPVQPPPVQPVVQQPVVQPVVQQPVVQLVAEEPLFFEEEPLFFEEPSFFEEPFFFQEPIFFGEPVFFGEALVLEENVGGGAVDATIPGDTGVAADSDGAVAVTGTVAAIS